MSIIMQFFKKNLSFEGITAGSSLNQGLPVSLNIFPASFFPFWDSRYIYVVSLMVSHRSLRLCSLFFILFSFYSKDWIISIDHLKVHHSLFFLLKSVIEPFSEFFIFAFLLLNFSTSGFYWVLIYNFCVFIETLFFCFHLLL